jgi:hypothetical protein
MLERLGYISPNDALENYYKLSKKVLDESGPEQLLGIKLQLKLEFFDRNDIE